MGLRLDLHEILKDCLGSANVYYQPPPSVNIKYPCIIYTRVYINSTFANNIPYQIKDQYQIIVVDANPDSLIPHKISKLSACKFDRRYTRDNLNHDVFNIYY